MELNKSDYGPDELQDISDCAEDCLEQLENFAASFKIDTEAPEITVFRIFLEKWIN